MDDQTLLKPKRNMTIDEVTQAFAAVYGYRESEELDRLLNVVAKVQGLKPNQQLRSGRSLSREDVGLTLTVNGQTGELTDIVPLSEGERSDKRPTMVVGGRMYVVRREEHYILTYPAAEEA